MTVPQPLPDRRARFLREAPAGLVDLMRRLTHHRSVQWQAEEYEEGPDGRKPAPSLEEAEAISSALPATEIPPPTDPVVIQLLGGADGIPAQHALVIDVDVPAWLVPSTTPGHSHLYVDIQAEEGDLWEFLEAAAAIGLVEPGYVSACRSRGMTSVRAPWVIKGEEACDGLTPDSATPTATPKQEEPF